MSSHPHETPLKSALEPGVLQPSQSGEKRAIKKPSPPPVVLQESPPDHVFQVPPNPHRAPSRRIRNMILSALVVVALPTLLATIYYIFLASDQYASTGHFVIKHRNDNGAALTSLSFLGLNNAQSSSVPDTLIVNDYILSPQILRDLAPRIDLRAIYSQSKIDWIARLRPSWHSATITEETLLKYWRKMVSVHFDTATGISALEVRAFTPEDAQRIADEIFVLGEELVNRLATRAQEDALALAKREVEAYRKRAMDSLDELQAFQERAEQIDPQAFAAARSQIQAGFEQDLTQMQAQLNILRKNLPEDAPGILQLRERLDVFEGQLAKERGKSTTLEGDRSASQVLNEFRKLQLESDFSTRAYMSSLASLESARLEAIRQNLYLETFVRPQLAQSPEYPKAVRNTLVVLVVAFVCWSIGSLFVSAARHHI